MGEQKYFYGLRVIIESPYAATDKHTIAEHVAYAQACMKEQLDMGNYPMLSHLLYTQAYEDADEDARRRGMEAGWGWMERADLVMVYTDMGLTSGMQKGIEQASIMGIPVVFRQCEEWDATPSLHFDVPRPGELVKAWVDRAPHLGLDGMVYYETRKFPNGS